MSKTVTDPQAQYIIPRMEGRADDAAPRDRANADNFELDEISRLQEEIRALRSLLPEVETVEEAQEIFSQWASAYAAFDNLEKENETLRGICQTARDTLGEIDDWLGSASTRQAAMDSLWRLQRRLQQAGFTYNWRNALDWRHVTLKELNDAGFFNSADFFRYDPTADKEQPYRVYGNAEGPTLKEFVAQRNAMVEEIRLLRAALDAVTGAQEWQGDALALQMLLDDLKTEFAAVYTKTPPVFQGRWVRVARMLGVEQ